MVIAMPQDLFSQAKRAARAAVLLAALAGGAAQAQNAPAPGAQSAAPSIPVMLPKVQTVSDTLEVTGNAEAIAQASLVARVPGYLEKIHFEDGAFVKKGDLLFTIQQDQYKAQLQQAQAQLLAQQVARDHAKLEVARYTDLLKQHATSEVSVDHWVFQQKTAEANIIGAEAQIDIARLNLSYTEVRAPFDGQMSKHLIDVGNMAGSDPKNSILADITELNPIYIIGNISSEQAMRIRANLDQRRLTLQELHDISFDAALQDESGFPHHGKMQYVAPSIDPKTGTLYVRGVIDNPNRTVLPGMFVNMRLPMGKVVKSALLAPTRALQEDQGGRYLLVAGDDDVVQKRYVTLGAIVGAYQVIASGLSREDNIVVGELWRVSPGIKITPKPANLDQ